MVEWTLSGIARLTDISKRVSKGAERSELLKDKERESERDERAIKKRRKK